MTPLVDYLRAQRAGHLPLAVELNMLKCNSHFRDFLTTTPAPCEIEFLAKRPGGTSEHLLPSLHKPILVNKPV